MTSTPYKLIAAAIFLLTIPHRAYALGTSMGVSQILELEVGQQTLLTAKDVKSFSEGTKGVVDIRLTPSASDFVIVGEAAGSTTLLLLYGDDTEKHYIIEVVDPDAAGPPPETNYGPGTVALRDNIQLDIYFLDIADDYTHQLGLRWPNSVGAALNVAFDLTSGSIQQATVAVGNDILPRLDFAQSSGWAKVQRRAAMVTANGSTAKLSGGGEVNVPVSGGLSAGLQQVAYGSIVEVTPRYDSESGRLELALNISMSDLSDDQGTGVPGRSTSSLQSVVNIELGQALVLAGLDSESTRRSHSGWPGLSQIPIIGALFGTHADGTNRRRTLLVVQPSVRDAASAESMRLVEDALSLYREFDGDWDDVDRPIGRLRSKVRGPQ